jgi:hypothetical protein
MNGYWMKSFAVAACCFGLAKSATAGITYATTATVIPISDYKSQDSPNSSAANYLDGTSFAKSDAYSIRGWINSGNQVKDSNARYEEDWNAYEFNDQYGVFSGTVDITASYRISLSGNSVNGGSVGLRFETSSISDDTFSTTSPVSKSGTLHVSNTLNGFSNIQIRITGDVSTGGNSFGSFAIAITDISYAGQTIFTGPPLAPEPSTAFLAGWALIAAAGFHRRLK